MGETEQFVNFVRERYKDDEIKVILDLGSRDGLQSVEFAKAYPNAKIYAFECNPETIGQVIMNTNNYENISVNACAVGDKEGVIDFYQSIHGNPGSSSVFEKSGNYDYIENYIQRKIQVPMIRLEEWAKRNGIDRVDLVWADMQGSELNAFNGMGKLFDTVKAVMTEVEYKEMYKGQPLYSDIKSFLENKCFKELWKKSVHDDFFGEAIFIKQKIAVLTFHNAQIAHWANRTAKIKENYCKRNGYDFILETEFGTERPASWYKIPLTEKHLSNYDWIFVTGADMLFLNDTRLETFIDNKFDMIIEKDYTISDSINADAFFIKNTRWSFEFLKMVWENNNSHPWWEQQSMIEIMQRNPFEGNQIKVVRDRPERCFNCFLPDYKDGDFVIHFAGTVDKAHEVNKWIIERKLDEGTI